MVNMDELESPVMHATHQSALLHAYDWFVVRKNAFSNWEESDEPERGRYRGDNGAMCPVGLLISDEEYSPEMEGHAPAVVNNEENPFRFLTDYNLKFLFGLVEVHDKALSYWREGNEDGARLQFEIELARLATDWNLDMPTSMYAPYSPN